MSRFKLDELELLIRGKKWVRRNPTTAVESPRSSFFAGYRTSSLEERINRPRPATGIAVLPFENLSNNKEDTSFADGVQDDILTKLAKIADLKVISRTSVMQYRGKRNMRQIGDALRVSHVLEGSVRKDGNRLHINAQLIDTRTELTSGSSNMIAIYGTCSLSRARSRKKSLSSFTPKF